MVTCPKCGSGYVNVINRNNKISYECRTCDFTFDESMFKRFHELSQRETLSELVSGVEVVRCPKCGGNFNITRGKDQFFYTCRECGNTYDEAGFKRLSESRKVGPKPYGVTYVKKPTIEKNTNIFDKTMPTFPSKIFKKQNTDTNIFDTTIPEVPTLPAEVDPTLPPKCPLKGHRHDISIIEDEETGHIHFKCGDRYVPRGPVLTKNNATMNDIISYLASQQKTGAPEAEESTTWSRTRDKIIGRAVELSFLFILGVIVLVFLPSFDKLAYALVMYGFYNVFPDKYDLIFNAEKKLEKRIKQEGGEELPPAAVDDFMKDTFAAQMGWMWVKLFLKFMITLLVGAQLISVHPLLALVVFLYTYFTLSSTYSDDEPHKAVEGWYRFFLGIFIAVFFWAVFSGEANMFSDMFWLVFTIFTMGIGPIFTKILPDYLLWLTGQPPAPATLLFFLALAYFATFPSQTERR